MNNFDDMIIKINHIIKYFIRRHLWIKLIVPFIILIIIVKIMNREPKLPTLYEYYNIKSGRSSGGLNDNGPLVFKLNGKSIQITSGTIHYFRVHPDYWRDRLQKLRAMGALAVETYVPWNLHEPEMNDFDFGGKNNEMSKFLDIVKFITIAKEEDLFVILRPGPYICAEWEFGGLPSYLLNLNVKLRTSDKEYMARVEIYLKELIKRIAPLQIYYGGPIIMVQIENEYGTLYDLDHEYMVELKRIMVEQGLKGLFFTADSPIPYGSKGSLAEQGVLQTANFKLEGQMQLEALKDLQPNKPAMVMEFWTGWFDHWDQPVHNIWSVKDYLSSLKEVLTFPASINLYVFHGGTTFGFLNGANHDEGNPESYHPDTTSYDYDALLTENGDYTEKYFSTRNLFLNLHNHILHPALPEVKPRILQLSTPVTQVLPWSEISKQMPPYNVENSKVFIHMEDLPRPSGKGRGQNYGFVHYTQTINVNKENPSLQITGPIRDIVVVLLDGIRQTEILIDPNDAQGNVFGFWGARDEILELKTGPGIHKLEYIVENCGRINYVKSLSDFPKKKGFGPDNQIVIDGGEVQGDIKIIGLPFTSSWVMSLTGWKDNSKIGVLNAPAFFKTTFTISSQRELTDTYLDIRRWKKGVVFINGFNIGRYYSGGPQLTMYIPSPILKVGENIVIIYEQYESDGNVSLTTEPIFL
uniref:Beta-galactosidase n=1 Tax=Clastoptera arizonana TaxID=38151 RepID=A0A1B6DW49_9HEMI